MNNLIEKLGGYDAAKRYTSLRSGADNESVCAALRNELLQYRCVNNIFEVGDKVVLVDLRCSNDIWCVSESSTSDYVGVIKEGMLGFSVMHKSMIRHTTDEEIALGYRK